MSEKDGPPFGMATGDRRRPPSVEICRIEWWTPRGVSTAMCLGWERGPAGPEPRLWTLQVRDDGTLAQALYNGRACALAEVPGLVCDLARTLVLDAKAAR